jgi:hypothetical protein
MNRKSVAMPSSFHDAFIGGGVSAFMYLFGVLRQQRNQVVIIEKDRCFSNASALPGFVHNGLEYARDEKTISDTLICAMAAQIAWPDFLFGDREIPTYFATTKETVQSGQIPHELFIKKSEYLNASCQKLLEALEKQLEKIAEPDSAKSLIQKLRINFTVPSTTVMGEEIQTFCRPNSEAIRTNQTTIKGFCLFVLLQNFFESQGVTIVENISVTKIDTQTHIITTDTQGTFHAQNIVMANGHQYPGKIAAFLRGMAYGRIRTEHWGDESLKSVFLVEGPDGGMFELVSKDKNHIYFKFYGPSEKMCQLKTQKYTNNEEEISFPKSYDSKTILPEDFKTSEYVSNIEATIKHMKHIFPKLEKAEILGFRVCPLAQHNDTGTLTERPYLKPSSKNGITYISSDKFTYSIRNVMEKLVGDVREDNLLEAFLALDRCTQEFKEYCYSIWQNPKEKEAFYMQCEKAAKSRGLIPEFHLPFPKPE